MNNTIKQKDTTYIAHTYRRYPLLAKSGKGCIIYDDEGKEYLDFTSGIGVNGLGYGFAPWVEATTKQVTELAHISNLFYSEPAVEVAETLCKKTDMKRVFFANSGAEANEGAIKIARKYANDVYHGERKEIITLKNSFHGRTLTTLSATGQDSFHQNFGPFVDGFTYVEPDNFEQLKEHINDKTLAIMVEIVQGEGGVVPLAKSYLHAIQDICDHRDILFIIDEVQTGIGRCGALFAYMKYGLHPDLVTCAKGLGNGLPIGAILLGAKCSDTLSYGDHGTTFGGNLVACAGAKVVLDHMNDKLYTHVNQIGDFLATTLSNLPYVKHVDGLGLMLGVTLDKQIDAREVVEACLEKGVILLTAKNKVRLLPPLIISEADIIKGMQVLESVLITLGEKQ